ncbi:Gelsolin [Dirofilaria immitis]|nr:Gelsolin [Dirofilaria immitis]
MRTADSELKDIGKQRGMEIWRIKNFALEKLSSEQFGSFYVGDSYILLYVSTINPGEWNVHFWLGNETTQDEQGAAAIMTVQGHESALFLSYFKDGIRYLNGGVASGFTHVTDKYENWKPKLFQCKGKRNVRCQEVVCKRESLNLGDVFILDCGLKIYVWMPPESGRLERIKGIDQARSIRDRERIGKPEIIILDSEWNTNDEFWKTLGGKGKLSQQKQVEKTKIIGRLLTIS